MAKGLVDRIVSHLHPGGEEQDDDSGETLVDSVVMTCPVCGRQRPFEISREKYADGHENHRLEKGIGLHLAITHQIQDEQNSVLTEEALSESELTQVPKSIIRRVDKKSRKWRRDYDLSN